MDGDAVPEVLELEDEAGGVARLVVLAAVEDELGMLLVGCDEAALGGDPDAPLDLQVLRAHASKKGLRVEPETDPERAAWAVAVAEESFLEG
jgi:hypothetical protein